MNKMLVTLFISCLFFQLIQSPVTTPLGLIMLKTTSEELACPREDLSVARKEELRKLLLDQVQTVLGLLTGKYNCTCRVRTNICPLPLSATVCEYVKCWQTCSCEADHSVKQEPH